MKAAAVALLLGSIPAFAASKDDPGAARRQRIAAAAELKPELISTEQAAKSSRGK
jgi:hypothetical protein